MAVTKLVSGAFFWPRVAVVGLVNAPAIDNESVLLISRALATCDSVDLLDLSEARAIEHPRPMATAVALADIARISCDLPAAENFLGSPKHADLRVVFCQVLQDFVNGENVKDGNPFTEASSDPLFVPPEAAELTGRVRLELLGLRIEMGPAIEVSV